MTATLNIAAPFSGTVVALSSVPDVVFAQEILGSGIALEPHVTGEFVDVHAPISGVVTAVFPHAFSIDAGSDQNVLVHLGIDTVTLKGAGFELLTSVGEHVTEGQVLIRWDVSATLAAGLSALCPVLAVQCEEGSLTPQAAVGASVDEQEILFSWSV